MKESRTVCHVFLALAAVAVWGQSVDTHREGIDQFHQRDLQAMRSLDISTITDLIDDEVVSFPPEDAPVSGKGAVLRYLEQGRAASTEFRASEIRQNWSEPVIAGDFAFEWGSIESVQQRRNNGEAVRVRNKVLRILKRSANGEWKVYRVMWNRDNPSARGDLGGIVHLAHRIRTADYEGDRSALRTLHDALATYLTGPEIVSRVHYWRGFALWRRALNGFNDAVDASESEQDLKSGLEEFEAAAAEDPVFADAKIGAASCAMGLLYLQRGAAAELTRLITRAREWLRSAMELDPDNPRLLWVQGARQWYLPPEAGGSRPKALETYERGLQSARARKPSANPLDPNWGEAELLMNLAWSNLNATPSDLAAAERYARDALQLVPNWHYVRDILLPQIERAQR